VDISCNLCVCLEGGIANKPADFVVETNGEVGALGFAIEGSLVLLMTANRKS